MGREKTQYKKTLEQQAYMKMQSMLHFGESKREFKTTKPNTLDRQGDETDGRIFSIGTYKSYWRSIKYFLRFVKAEYPEITTLKKCRPLVAEWILKEELEGKSAWTIQLHAKALGKLFGITEESNDYVVPKQRKRADIKRSRGVAKRDAHFSEKNNHVLVCFCKGTGLRRSELSSIKKEDLYTKEQVKNRKFAPDFVCDENVEAAIKDVEVFEEQYFIFVKGKGGRVRFAPILDKHLEIVLKKFDDTLPSQKVWPSVNSNADIHSYRSDYANSIYLEYARPLEDIPPVYEYKDKDGNVKKKMGIYYMRKDEKGCAYDRRAMEKCSKALGHSRVVIVAESYLRNI